MISQSEHRPGGGRGHAAGRRAVVGHLPGLDVADPVDHRGRRGGRGGRADPPRPGTSVGSGAGHAGRPDARPDLVVPQRRRSCSRSCPRRARSRTSATCSPAPCRTCARTGSRSRTPTRCCSSPCSASARWPCWWTYWPWGCAGPRWRGCRCSPSTRCRSPSTWTASPRCRSWWAPPVTSGCWSPTTSTGCAASGAGSPVTAATSTCGRPRRWRPPAAGSRRSGWPWR